MPKKGKEDRVKSLAEELDTFDIMLSALVEVLEEKGILTQEELEKKIKGKVMRAGGLTQYRDIQFDKQ